MQTDPLAEVPRAAMASPVARGYTLCEHMFAREIERLRDENAQLREERDNATGELSDLEQMICERFPYAADADPDCLEVASPSECVDGGAADIARLRAENARLRGELRDLLRAVDAIGGAAAWRGTLGNDGQGHDEGEILADAQLRQVRAALKPAEPDGGEG